MGFCPPKTDIGVKMRKVLVSVLVGFGIFWAGYATNVQIERNRPVCHALTEDSVMSDCDYRNGAWYRK